MVSNGFFNAGPGAFGSGFSQCLSDEQKLTNFGTARVRAGYLMHDTLFYGTAGAAWGTIMNNFALSTNFDPTSLATPFNPFFGGGGNFSHTKGGYTLGGGVETRLWGAWSLKLEYLYVDLGTTTDAFPVGINPAPFLTVNGPGVGAAIVANSSYTITSSSHFRDNIVRVGLNYKPW
jgi:outer membrane immunogenic protein